MDMVAYGYQTWRIYRRLGREDWAKALVVGSLASVIGFFHIEGLFELPWDSVVITLTYFLMACPFVIQRAPLSARHWTHSLSVCLGK